jgi:Fe2+ or Zn2+ uptake regulation protein
MTNAIVRYKAERKRGVEPTTAHSTVLSFLSKTIYENAAVKAFFLDRSGQNPYGVYHFIQVFCSEVMDLVSKREIALYRLLEKATQRTHSSFLTAEDVFETAKVCQAIERMDKKIAAEQKLALFTHVLEAVILKSNCPEIRRLASFALGR